MAVDSTHALVAEVWREESAKIVGLLARVLRDVGRAEEIAQDALVAALEEWPRTGVPARPAAWLVTTAKNRALNALRHARVREREHGALERETPASSELSDVEAALEAAIDEDLHDDALRLVFTTCHPALAPEARVALTLRLVLGLETSEIARAFLVPEATIAQRIVRAKRTIAEQALPFEVPRGEQLGARLRSVLEAVYLLFTEGHSATAGEELLREPLTREALRLGRLLAALAPEEPEVHGLLALMELTDARRETRVDANGDAILLADQDRSRWDASAIARGLGHLGRARELAHDAPGVFVLQAEIAARHAQAPHIDQTRWDEVVALYEALAEQAPSPVVALSHALAVSRARGAEQGLALLDALAREPALARYPWLAAAQADLLARLGRAEEAALAFERAAALTENARQRTRLRARAAALRP